MIQLECRGLIFDLDGVLVDSIPSVLQIWREWAQQRGIRHPDLDSLAITARTQEAVQQLDDSLDIEAEVQYLEEKEATANDNLCPVKGARSLLNSLPSESWAVFTSVSHKTALAKLQAAGLPEPKVLISGDQVKRGKPHPHGYLLASQKLGVIPEDCLVIEDTPAGIQAARAGGIPVIALATSHPPEQLINARVVLPDLEAIQVVVRYTQSTQKPDHHCNRPTLVIELNSLPLS